MIGVYLERAKVLSHTVREKEKMREIGDIVPQTPRAPRIAWSTVNSYLSEFGFTVYRNGDDRAQVELVAAITLEEEKVQ